MTDDLERARPADRDQAIAVVEAAYASGRIVDHDRVFRVEQIRSAGLRGEVRALIRDLPQQTPTGLTGLAGPSRPMDAAARPQPPHPAPGWPTRGSVLPKLLVVLAAIAVIAVGAVAMFASLLARPGTDGATVTEYPQAPGRDLLTKRGYAELVDAVEERTGRREAFQLVLYPDRATIAVPVDKKSRRQMSYAWDGEWSDFEGLGTSPFDRFSLDDVNGGLLSRMVTKARRQIEDATTWYVVIRPAMFAGDDWTVMAIASNDFSETATVRAGLDGRIEKP